MKARRQGAFSREDIRNLTPLAAGVGLMLASMQIKQLLREQALLDGLTGAHNRRAMESIVVEELERSRRHDHDVSFVMLDVDEFKSINDRLGHAEGDRVLETLVAVLHKSLRSIDKVIRYGGDEFLLVLPETSQRETELAARTAARELETQVVTAMGPVHCSVGIATVQGDPRGRGPGRACGQAHVRGQGQAPRATRGRPGLLTERVSRVGNRTARREDDMDILPHVIEGEHVFLAPERRDNVPLYWKWANDREVTRLTQGMAELPASKRWRPRTTSLRWRTTSDGSAST